MMTQAISWDDLRFAVNRLAEQRREWAGYPMPIEGLALTVEKRHPLASTLEGAGFGLPEKLPPDCKVRNHWFSWRLQSDVYLCEETDGRLTKWVLPKVVGGIRALFDQFSVVCQAWDYEAELVAREKLASMITPHAFRCYDMIGMFLESSKRSNVTYLFRRLAPTIAIGQAADGELQALAGLCLHPIGYYQSTPCGSMVPTDDVIAHLCLMRGDEHFFWRKANHHRAWE